MLLGVFLWSVCVRDWLRHKASIIAQYMSSWPCSLSVLYATYIHYIDLFWIHLLLVSVCQKSLQTSSTEMFPLLSLSNFTNTFSACSAVPPSLASKAFAKASRVTLPAPYMKKNGHAYIITPCQYYIIMSIL